MELAHPGSTRCASFLRAVTQAGYVRNATAPPLVGDGGTYQTYPRKTLPPVEFEYSKAVIQDKVRELDPESARNLPVGLEGATYQWADLDGNAAAGIPRNRPARCSSSRIWAAAGLGPAQVLPSQPSTAASSSGR